MYIIDKTSSNSLGVKVPPWGGRGEGQIRTLGYLGYVYSRNADIHKVQKDGDPMGPHWRLMALRAILVA